MTDPSELGRLWQISNGDPTDEATDPRSGLTRWCTNAGSAGSGLTVYGRTEIMSG